MTIAVTMGQTGMDGKSAPQGEREGEDKAAGANRRQILMLGAVGASAVMSVRPALAQSAASVLNCSIPVPDASHGGRAVALDGSLVDTGTPGSYPGGRSFSGDQVRQALRGRSLPGTSQDQSRAYLNYIRRLQHGQAGFTCYASLQMPR